MKLIRDLLSDNDEYQSGNGDCTDQCNSITGSYYCFYWHGYKLSNDDHTCIDRYIAIATSYMHS